MPVDIETGTTIFIDANEDSQKPRMYMEKIIY
jgi:hypothetical protein